LTKKELQLQSLNRAIKQLEKVLKEEKSEFIRDAAIQRFEFTYELLWKTLKTHLEEIHGVRAVSPRQVFKEAFRLELINDESVFLEMIEARNLIAHTYNENQSESLYKALPKFIEGIKAVTKLLNNA
jgi:nucleotidyltransferase substrate binding protein (TIGR01987 family)